MGQYDGPGGVGTAAEAAMGTRPHARVGLVASVEHVGNILGTAQPRDFDGGRVARCAPRTPSPGQLIQAIHVVFRQLGVFVAQRGD